MMYTYKKIITKSTKSNVHCYDFSECQATAFVDPDKTDTFKKLFFPSDVAYGMCIEPLYGEYAMLARRGQEVNLPANEYQDNSVCLFFTKPERIDALIAKLQECKKKLNAKILAAQKEEYRRKYYGQIVHFEDLRNMAQDATSIRRECMRQAGVT